LDIVSDARFSYPRETEFCRPYGWRDEHDAKNSVSTLKIAYFEPRRNFVVSSSTVQVSGSTVTW
jgi:hypothetical protein